MNKISQNLQITSYHAIALGPMHFHTREIVEDWDTEYQREIEFIEKVPKALGLNLIEKWNGMSLKQHAIQI